MFTARQAQGAVRRFAPPTIHRLAFTFMHPANRGHRLAAVGRVARYEVRTRLLRRPSIVPLGERSRIIAYTGETNPPHAVHTNPPNWRETRTWQRVLGPGDLFVDVGGNVGIYTILAHDLGAETITFEPDRHNCERIRENLSLNDYTGEVLDKAAADAPGTVRLTEGLDSYNHLLGDGEPGGVEVEAVTVDSVIGDRHVAGLKVDVEGAERLVLEGARRALSEGRIRLIQVEWSGDEVQRTLGESRQPLEELLRSYGYLLYRPDELGRLHRIEGEVPPGRDVFASLVPLEEAAAP
ncbi:FkbM family methyltransferase [Geodermatophilus sp. SYSU D00684]